MVVDSTVAAHIYHHKILFQSKNGFQRTKPALLHEECNKVAKTFGISAKCVREIWKHKIWVSSTKHFWNVNSLEEVKRLNEIAFFYFV